MASTKPEPLHITLELARAVRTGDEYFYRFVPMQYLLRQQGGRYQSADFNWTAELQEQIAALQNARPDPALAQRIGRLLYEFLSAAGFAELEDSIIQAVRAHRPVYLTLCFAAAELFTLPWELVTLRSGERLAAIPEVLIRYEWPDTVTRPLPTENALDTGRVLFAWSGAGGAVPAGEHLSAIAQACRRGNVDFDSTRDQVRNLSAASLLQALQRPDKPVAVLHLLCHGGVVESGSTVYGLVWNSADGDEPDVVDPEALGRLLSPFAATLRLVVVSACLGGNLGDVGSRLGSVAQALHRVGIEAVIASRMPLSVKGSIELSETFYNALMVTPQPLEEALRQARLRLAQDPVSLDWASIQLHARAAGGDDTRPLSFRPYRGLLAYHEDHRRFFFGRERETAELERRIQNAVAGSKPALQLLLGDAGTGKTSLVQAGLGPRLPKLANWIRGTVAPGSDPLVALWLTLQRLSPAVGEPPAQIDVAAVQAAARRLYVDRAGSYVLIVVDPLDDAFGPEVPTDVRDRFLEALWRLADTPEKGCVVLALLDGVPEAVPLAPGAPTLAELASNDETAWRLEALAGEPLAQAITRPARLLGLDFESGLLDRILADRTSAEDNLFLLSNTLDLLWQHREGSLLTAAAYKRTGGISGAIANGADRVLAALASDAARQVARSALLALVTVSDDGPSLTRRRVWRDDIRPVDQGASREHDAVIAHLVAERLVVARAQLASGGQASGAWLELAHEALLREWPTLRGWAEEQEVELRQMRDLRAGAQAWQRHVGGTDKGDSFLLRGEALAAARQRWIRSEDVPELLVREFYSASITAEAKRAQRARRLRLLQVAAVTLSLCLILGWWLGHRRQQTLNLQSTLEELLRKDQIGKDGATEAALMLLAMNPARPPQRLTTLGQHLMSSPIERRRFTVTSESIEESQRLRDPIELAELSLDERHIVAGTKAGRLLLWSAEDGRLMRMIADLRSHLRAVRFSPDSTRVLAAWHAGRLQVLAAESGERLFEHPGCSSLRVAHWSPDGRSILVGCHDGSLHVISSDLRDDREIFCGTASIERAGWSPDGTLVLATLADGNVALIESEGGAVVRIEERPDLAHHIAWSPDGRHVLTGSLDMSAALTPAGTAAASPLPLRGLISAGAWSPDGTRFLLGYRSRDDQIYVSEDSRPVAPLPDRESSTTAVAWSGDGERIAAGAEDGSIRLFTPAGHHLGLPALGHEGEVVTVQFGANGKLLFSAAADGSARLWDLPVQPSTLAGPDNLETAVISPDGLWIAAGGQDGRLYIWCTCPGAVAPRALLVHTGAIHMVRFLADSRHVVTASADGTGATVPLDESESVVRLYANEAGMSGAVPSPDGTAIATASNRGLVRVWDRLGQERRSFFAEGRVTSISWSPDGKWLAWSSRDGKAHVWAAGGAQAELLHDQPGTPIQALDWSHDSHAIALATEEGHIVVYASDGRQLREPIHVSEQALLQVRWSPDGSTIATTGLDCKIRLLSGALPAKLGLDPNEPIATLTSAGGMVQSLAWSHDGQHLAAGRDDHRVAVFSRVNGQWHELEPALPAASDAVQVVAFDARAERLLVASADGGVRLLPIPRDDSRPEQFHELRQRLRARTTLCLDVEKRVEHLYQRRSEAEHGWRTCEEEQGRLPKRPVADHPQPR